MRLLPVLLLATAVAAPTPVQAQAASPDSTELLEELREEQENFERYRESRIPVSTGAPRATCDARMGRICVWFGGAGEANFPPEPTETGIARGELIRALGSAAREIDDSWVLGQLVHYLAEDGRLAEAEEVARRCGLVEEWWCQALEGYTLHLQGRFVEAEDRFREAVAGVPPEEEDRWRNPRFLLTQDGRSALEDLDPETREQRLEFFWRLSDPLFLVDGNDRLTDHYARLVEARNMEDAENPYGMTWEEDLEESLVRYGRNIGYSRVRSLPSGMGGGGMNLQDSRRIVGHHHPQSRGYLFPEEFLEAPADVPPESWLTAPREARSWYAPPYAPDMRGLETQVARFRRGTAMLVVGAYRPDPPDRDALADFAPDPEPRRSDPFAPRSAEPAQPPPEDAHLDELEGAVEAGFFLIPEDGGEELRVPGDGPSGVVTMRAPAGRYVSSLEVLDREGRRAWRARQGVIQAHVAPGAVAVSDLLLLRRDAPFPESIDEAIPLARPGIRVGADERFTMAWEVYGLDVDDEVRVTVGFTRGRPGFLTRVGEFLGIIEPEQPLEISFTEAGRGEVETVFRALVMSLPDLDPGEYTLHLRAELPHREAAVSSRPITVIP